MMAVWTVARSQLRRRWGTTVALTLLVAVAGGTVLAGVAGASRTGSAMRRFVAYSRPEDLVVVVNGLPSQANPPTDPAEIRRAVARAERLRHEVASLPQVEAAARLPYLFLAADATGQDVGNVNPFAASDPAAYRAIDRPLLLAGRMARPDRADEAVIDDVVAAQRGLRIGSTLRLWAFSAEQMSSPDSTTFGKFPAPAGPRYAVRVVGIVREASTVGAPPASIAKDAAYDGQGTALLTPAFLHRYASDVGMSEALLPGMEMLRIRLRHGLADLAAFERGVGKLVDAGDGQVHLGSDIANASAKVGRAIHLEAIAILAFAGLAALAGLVLVGQTLGRQVVNDGADSATLAAFGLTGRQLALVPLVRTAVVAAGGAIGAAGFAVALSPRAPIGLARRAEIHPGVSVDVAVLGIGALAVAAAVIGCGAVPARRRARGPSASGRSTPTPKRVGSRPLPLGAAASAGLSMSFDRGAAFGTTLLAAVAATIGIVAAGTFGVSLHHLVGDPVQQGWNWDVIVGNPNSQALEGDPSVAALERRMAGLLERNRDVGQFSGFALGDGVTIAGHTVDLAGIDQVRGSVFPTVAAGRAPASAGEIALGGDALHELGARIGDRVTVHAGSRTATMRIVGQTLAPTAGDVAPRLSGGGTVTLAGFRRLLPAVPVFQFMVRYRAGVDHDAAFGSLIHDFGREVLRPYPGGEVGDLARVSSLPYVLAALLVILAVAALALTLLASVRRHRRDLAVLKTIGFVRGQVIGAVAAQATIIAAAALAIGIPSGVAVGRSVWRVVADGIGSVSPPVVPVAAVLLMLPATLVVANALAGGPAWSAGRVRPAELLRTE